MSEHTSAAHAAATTGHGGHEARLWDVLFRPVDQQQINQRNVVIDAIGVGITAGVGSFLSVFLVRLGASSFLIGLLTAMPALTGMLLAMPVGEFLARRPNVVPWFARSRFWVLSSYVLTGLVPFIFKSNQPEIIILIWALATVPQTVVSVAFTVVMGGVAGPRGRLTLMSRRWSWACSSAGATSSRRGTDTRGWRPVALCAWSPSVAMWTTFRRECVGYRWT